MLFLLLSCVPTESGIDSTSLSGTVQVPPNPEVFAETSDPGALGARDAFTKADGLGVLEYRYRQVTGTFREWPSEVGGPTDEDWYTMTANAAGTLTVSLTLDGGAEGPPAPDTATDTATDTETDTATDTGPVDTGPTWPLYEASRVVSLQVFDVTEPLGEDEDPVPLAELFTVDGVAELSLEAVEGGIYAFRVEGLQNLDDESSAYSIWLNGGSPALAGIQVGAYTDTTTVAERGALVGGAVTRDWVLDEDTRTWSAAYTMVTFKSVSSEAGTDGYGEETTLNTVTEGVKGEVALVAGRFGSLSAPLLGNTFFSDTIVYTTLKADTENTVDEALVVNSYSEFVIGKEVTEVEPNNVSWGDDGEIEAESGTPTDIGEVTGTGFVDLVHGVMSFPVDVADGGPPEGDESVIDHDVYVFTVPEELDVFVTMSWPNSDVNLDGYILDSSGQVLTYGYAFGDDNPELYQYSWFDLTLKAGETYYIYVGPWQGPAGEHAYDIRLEWIGL